MEEEHAKRDLARLQADLATLAERVGGMQVDLAGRMMRLQTTIERMPELCAYREQIAQIPMLDRRISQQEQALGEAVRTLQGEIHKLDLAIARAGALGGVTGSGVIAMVSGLVYGIGKLAGWW